MKKAIQTNNTDLFLIRFISGLSAFPNLALDTEVTGKSLPANTAKKWGKEKFEVEGVCKDPESADMPASNDLDTYGSGCTQGSGLF